MSQYDIDFEILYSVKSGHRTFDKIWFDVNGTGKRKKIGSRSTLSRHLSQLVEEGVLFKDEKSHYELGGDTSVFDSVNDTVKELHQEINTIKEKNKKTPDKKLLKNFIKDTEEDTQELSNLRFSNLIYQSVLEENIDDDYVKPYVGLNNKLIELIEKLIKTRMDILQERDQELYEMFFQCFT